jgi:hypothetical protein
MVHLQLRGLLCQSNWSFLYYHTIIRSALADGQFYDESGSTARFTFGIDFSATLRDYAVTDAQAEPGTFTNIFGGEERVKEVPQVFFGNPGPIVGEGDFYLAPNPFRSDGEFTSSVGFNHEILGIDNDVQKDLLQLKAVSHDFR